MKRAVRAGGKGEVKKERTENEEERVTATGST